MYQDKQLVKELSKRPQIILFNKDTEIEKNNQAKTQRI
jgi:hypothetical protein